MVALRALRMSAARRALRAGAQRVARSGARRVAMKAAKRASRMARKRLQKQSMKSLGIKALKKGIPALASAGASAGVGFAGDWIMKKIKGSKAPPPPMEEVLRERPKGV